MASNNEIYISKAFVTEMFLGKPEIVAGFLGATQIWPFNISPSKNTLYTENNIPITDETSILWLDTDEID